MHPSSGTSKARERQSSLAEERARWRFIGEGIHWPDLDEEISIESLLAGRRPGETQASLQRWLDEWISPLREAVDQELPMRVRPAHGNSDLRVLAHQVDRGEDRVVELPSESDALPQVIPSLEG